MLSPLLYRICPNPGRLPHNGLHLRNKTWKSFYLQSFKILWIPVRCVKRNPKALHWIRFSSAISCSLDWRDDHFCDNPLLSGRRRVRQAIPGVTPSVTPVEWVEWVVSFSNQYSGLPKGRHVQTLSDWVTGSLSKNWFDTVWQRSTHFERISFGFEFN